VRAYRTGDSVPALAKAFEVNETTVRAHLGRRGVETRGNGGYRKLHGAQLNQAVELYAAGPVAEVGGVGVGLVSGNGAVRTAGERCGAAVPLISGRLLLCALLGGKLLGEVEDGFGQEPGVGFGSSQGADLDAQTSLVRRTGGDVAMLVQDLAPAFGISLRLVEGQFVDGFELLEARLANWVRSR